MASLPNNLISPDEYLRLERAADFKSEYIAGEMVAMSGASLRHADIKGQIESILRGQLKGTPCRPVSSDLRVNVGTAFFYPDVVVYCGEPKLLDATYVDTLLSPTVVIEVLSPSTSAYDRGIKFLRYAQIASLQDYILVEQDQIQIEHFHRLPDGDWPRALILTAPNDVISLPSIHCSITLADAYDGIAI